MFTLYRPANYDNPRASSFVGLSTDEKPLDEKNGASFEEIDTGKVFRFDEENKVWHEEVKRGGGTSVYPYNNNPEALGHEANPGTSDNYSRGDHIHPLPSVSDLGALPVGNIANEFSTSSTYAVGDYVIYEGQLYQCTTAVTTAGSWNSSNWTQAVLGNDVSDLKNAINQKQDAPQTAGTAGQVLGLDSNLDPVWVDQTGGGGGGMNIVNLSGTQITQVGADNTMYMCGELAELTFTAPSAGITGIRFTSGTTPTVLTISGVTAWMFDFDPTSLEASTTYEINVLNGVGCAGWA